MAGQDAPTQLLLEPVFLHPTWHHKAFKLGWFARYIWRRKPTEFPHEESVGLTVVPNRLIIRVTHRSGSPPPPSFTLSGLDIRMDIGLGKAQQKFGPATVDWPEGQRIVEVGPLTASFPTPGRYWIKCTVDSEMVDARFETKQRMATGEEARGWSSDDAKHRWRNPITAFDIGAAKQVLIAERVRALTIVASLVGAFSIGSRVLQIADQVLAFTWVVVTLSMVVTVVALAGVVTAFWPRNRLTR